MIVADLVHQQLDARAVQLWESLRRYEDYLFRAEEIVIPKKPREIELPPETPPFVNKVEQIYWEDKCGCSFWFTPFGEVTKGKPK